MDDYLAKPVRRDEAAAVLARWASAPATPTDALDKLREFQVAGEPDVVADIMRLFQEQAPRWLEALRTAAAAAQPRELGRAAHRLAGDSALLGLSEITRLCRDLESLSQTGSTDGAVDVVQELEAAFERTLTNLQPSLVAV
jgi:HPt (histidine-containing phosphotransfer) domain-containing protein